MPPPTTALLALTSQRGLLPLLPYGLPWTAALHDALVKASDDRQGRGPARCFSGRDELGKPRENHHHAFLLPLSLEMGDAVTFLVYRNARKPHCNVLPVSAYVFHNDMNLRLLVGTIFSLDVSGQTSISFYCNNGLRRQLRCRNAIPT